MRYHLQVFRLGAFGLAAALAGCASMPGRVASAPGYSSTARGSAYSTGQDCYAPTPNLNAAYNQPYEINGTWYHPMRNDAGFSENGIASWYDQQSSSNITAMGTAFHARQMTAASRTLPLPSCVRVTNLENGRSLVVLVDDRGPFVSGRIMDISYGAAPKTPTRILRQWRQPAQPKAIYLETATPMQLPTAVRERSKLRDFGISTARMVPVSSSAAGSLYKIKIGPMAPTAAPENYAASLRRLRLGTFVVSGEHEG